MFLQVIVEQSQFYKQEAPLLYQILLVLSTQIMGYAIAGVTRQYLVRPSGMIWPGTLVSTAMFTTLHKEENLPANGWRISRWRFFMVAFLSSFAFYFLPGLLMPALSYFNVLTWFAPENVIVANLVSRQPDFYAHEYLRRIVWHLFWSWIISSDFRLESDRLHWIPAGGSILGRAQCCGRFGCGHVDHCSYPM